MKQRLFITAALLLSTMSIFAHALWIETNPTGKAGQLQQVKIFYGEYSENSPEKPKEWYSDVREFQLWLVTPDNQKIQLPTTEGEDGYTASFTPEKNGSYTLFISHDAKDLGRTTKYQFNTSAVVTVGAATEDLARNANPLKFSVKGNKVKRPVVINGVFNNAPSEKYTATIFSPQGWTKEVKANAAGVVEFTPEWPGKYMIEIARTDEEKGEHHTKAYDKVWRCATYLVEVGK